jgi:hypothetical protein
MNRSTRSPDLRHLLFVVGFGAAGLMGTVPVQAQELCGGVDYPFPYTDVSGVGAAFCAGIMEAYVTGVSKGTAPTTFSPNNTVTRVQMTTFLQRSLDQGLARTRRRAAFNQWWIPQNTNALQTIFVGNTPGACVADGAAIWTSTFDSETVVEVQGSTGKVLGTWTGATNSGGGVLVAAGKVYVAASGFPGNLYVIDPTLPPGPVTVAANNLGNGSAGIVTDGTNIWTADNGPPGSVSIINPQSYSVNTVTTGFNAPIGILYDGANIWVTDNGAGTLLKLDTTDGTILKTVVVGSQPYYPVFDGTNIWVPNYNDNSITVVQASTGNVVATITANANNQLNGPLAASFDGERVLVANFNGNTVTLFKAADLSFIANVTTGSGTEPAAACSDGVNFWVTTNNSNLLLRF